MNFQDYEYRVVVAKRRMSGLKNNHVSIYKPEPRGETVHVV